MLYTFDLLFVFHEFTRMSQRTPHTGYLNYLSRLLPAIVSGSICFAMPTVDVAVPQTVDTVGTELSPELYVIGDTADYERDFGTGTFSFGSTVGSWNQLSIQNGGDLINGIARVGYFGAAGNNTITVTGEGSTWNSSSILTVGASGSSNAVVFENGATGSANLFELGAFGGSNSNTFTVSGTGSQFTSTTGFRVGVNGGSNSLLIENGGSISVTGEVDLGYHSKIPLPTQPTTRSPSPAN